jgi:hypothetical protein
MGNKNSESTTECCNLKHYKCFMSLEKNLSRIVGTYITISLLEILCMYKNYKEKNVYLLLTP